MAENMDEIVDEYEYASISLSFSSASSRSSSILLFLFLFILFNMINQDGEACACSAVTGRQRVYF